MAFRGKAEFDLSNAREDRPDTFEDFGRIPLVFVLKDEVKDSRTGAAVLGVTLTI